MEGLFELVQDMMNLVQERKTYVLQTPSLAVHIDEVEKEMLARMKEIDAEKAKKVYKSGATYGGYNGYGNNYGTTGYQSRYPGLQVGAATGKGCSGTATGTGSSSISPVAATSSIAA